MSMSDWKESSVYRLSGSILTHGRYVGDDGSAEGTPVTFTPDIIRMLHRNAKSNIPFVVDHSGFDTVGSTFKVGITPSADDLMYEGLVFDQTGVKAIGDGYSKLSPEIEFVFDENDNVVDAFIKRIALVKDPAIDGTGIRSMHVAFSKPKVNDMAEETETSTEEQTEETSSEEEVTTSSTDETSSDDSSSEPTMSDIMAAFKEMKAQNDELKAKYDEVIKANKKLSNTQVDNLKAEVSKLGIDVNAITAGLNDDKKIQVLLELKKSAAKKPGGLLGTPSKLGPTKTPEQKQKETAFVDALSRLGLDHKTYLELTGKNKGES